MFVSWLWFSRVRDAKRLCQQQFPLVGALCWHGVPYGHHVKLPGEYMSATCRFRLVSWWYPLQLFVSPTNLEGFWLYVWARGRPSWLFLGAPSPSVDGRKWLFCLSVPLWLETPLDLSTCTSLQLWSATRSLPGTDSSEGKEQRSAAFGGASPPGASGQGREDSSTWRCYQNTTGPNQARFCYK